MIPGSFRINFGKIFAQVARLGFLGASCGHELSSLVQGCMASNFPEDSVKDANGPPQDKSLRLSGPSRRKARQILH